MTKQSETKQTLEMWVSNALRPEATTSADDLQALLEGIRQGIEDQDKLASTERSRSLNPLLPAAEAEACAQRASLAELKRDRYKAAIAPIEIKLREAIAADIRDRCLVQRAEIQTKLDAAVEQFRKYPEFAEAIIDLFEIAELVDQEIEDFNATKVVDVPRLTTVELAAREIAGFNSHTTPSIAAECVLPRWMVSSKNAWPKREPSSVNSIAASLFGAPAHRGADWHKDIAARDTELRKEAAKLNNYYKERERRREELNNTEIAAARAAQQQQRRG